MTEPSARSTTRPRDSSTSLRTSARLRVGGPDLDQRELLLDRRLGGDVLDLEHVDQPVELLGGLLDRDVVAVEGDRHPADVVAVGVADRERIDVEVARPHQARHAVEDARLVEDDRDQHVAPGLAAARQRSGGGALWAGACWRPRPGARAGRRCRCGRPVGARVGAHSSAPPHFSIRSDRPLPAGIIGKMFCSSAISNQMSAGPSTACAARIAVVDLVRRPGPEGRDAEGVGELGEVRPGQAGRVVVARVDDLLPLADHPELLVVEQRDLDRDVVRDEGHQLLERHLEAAVAGDRPGLAVRPAERRAHRRRHGEAHRARGRPS